MNGLTIDSTNLSFVRTHSFVQQCHRIAEGRIKARPVVGEKRLVEFKSEPFSFFDHPV